MKFSRAKLQGHLRRISVETEVSEVVLRPDLSASAITPDHSLVIDVPALVKDEDDQLPEEVGIIDLNMFIQALNLSEDPEVSVELEEQRLLIDEGEAGTTKFLTGSPSTIGTVMDEDEREGLLNAIQEQEGVPIGRDLISAVKGRQELLGAIEVKLKCSKKGTTFVIGSEKGHYGTFEFADLKTSGKEKYELIFQANTLSRIFKIIPDPDEAEIVLTGEDSVVGITFDDHTYILGPMQEKD